MDKHFPIENTGAKERPEDRRDYGLGSTALAEQIPAVFMQEKAWNLRVLFQGKRPACGAHAGASLKMLLDEYEDTGRRYYTPRFTWIDVKSFDGYALEDGTDMRSVFKSLQNSGALDFDQLGNEVELDEKTYASRSAVTAEMRDSAHPRVIGNYGFTNRPSFNQIKQAIYKNKGVLLLIRIGEEFYTDKRGRTSWAEKDVLPLRTPTRGLSGHFVTAHSYDENYIYFMNSFGSTWGRKGHGYFGAEYMPYVLEMGTAADISDLLVPAQKKLIGLLKQVLGIK